MVIGYTVLKGTHRISDKKLVHIKKFTLIGQDEHGVTAEFSLPRKQAVFVLITRKEKSVSGNAYHEGKSMATNPKTFVLLSGDITFSYRKVGTTELHSEFIQAPAVIEVAPYVTHKSVFLFHNTQLVHDILLIVHVTLGKYAVLFH